jgi:hypothetical protein
MRTTGPLLVRSHEPGSVAAVRPAKLLSPQAIVKSFIDNVVVPALVDELMAKRETQDRSLIESQ